MTRKEQLNNLFDEWERERPEYKDQFIRDGIFDEEKYDRQLPKLLFISKEVNGNPGKRKSPDGVPTSYDLSSAAMDDLLNYSFYRRIAEWAWGIYNDFPPFDIIYRNKGFLSDCLNTVAFMDAKKSEGGSVTFTPDLLVNIRNNQDFLLRQIKIIKPDIIVSCLTDINLVQALFSGLQFYKAGYVRCVARWEGYKVIDFYHPSAQTVPAASYSLLQNIYRSEVFKNI